MMSENEASNLPPKSPKKTISNATKGTVSLKTEEDEVFEVEEPIAMRFKIVKMYFENPEATSFQTDVVPLPNVSSCSLERIIGYCKSHLEFEEKLASQSEVKAYNDEFFKKLNNDEIKKMILAANYLEIKELLDLLVQKMADRIKNKSVGYVRNFFGIENDYTALEEAELRRQSPWAFEDVDSDD